MKVIIDNGHGLNTPGKCSPDGRLKEWEYTREITARLMKHPELAKRASLELLVPEKGDVSLGQRVARVNALCDRLGAKNCLLVSVHVNAAANGGWHSASGFSVFCSKNASEASHRLAGTFTRLAGERDMLGNRNVPKEGYWTWSWTPADIAILRQTKCPAVLTENFFQDNRADVDFLLSEEGKRAVTGLHADAILAYLKTLKK